MIVIPLDKLTSDGFKQPANLQEETVTHARLYYDDFAGSNYIQGVFATDDSSTIQFDNASVSFQRFKLFKSSNGTTYTEVVSYGANDGNDEPVSGELLDPADFADYDILIKNTISTIEQFTGISLPDLIDAVGLEIVQPYYAYTNIFSQDNAVSSGKLRVDSTVLQNTVSDGTSLSLSSKVDTGIYMVQFRITDPNLGIINSFRIEVAGNILFGAQWEQVYKPVLNSSKEIIGHVIFGTNFISGDFDLDAGRIEVRTYDTSWVLADDILTEGITVSLKAFKQL